jgi:hypothetical protein
VAIVRSTLAEKEVIEAPEATGTEADSLKPFVTPPENPWLSDFTLRVTGLRN